MTTQEGARARRARTATGTPAPSSATERPAVALTPGRAAIPPIPERAKRVEGQPTVALLAATLGHAGVALLTGETTRTRKPTRAHLWEPGVALPTLYGGILLTPGARPLPTEVVEEAATRGFAAVMVKAFDADLTGLVAVAEARRVALFVVDDELEWLHLDKLVSNALQAARGVEVGLGSLAVGDLFALANAIAAAVGGATAIEDPEQRILAYSTLPDQPIDNDRRLGILGRQVPDGPENEAQYRQVFRSDGILRLPPLPGGGYDRLALPVRAGRQLLGSIWVIDAGGLIDNAEEYLTDVASLASLHLLRARSAEDLARQLRSDVVESVLDESTDARDGVRRLGMPAAGPFRVVALEPADPEVGAGPAVQQAADLALVVLESRFDAAALTLRGATMRALVAGPAAGERGDVAAALRHIVAQATSTLDLDLHAAMSATAEGPSEIVEARRSADRVLDLLRRQPWRGPLASSRELANELALHDVESLLRARPELLSLAAREIVDHDRAHGSDYATLLRTWFDARQDTALTASRMTLHPNTVRYRLGRVSTLFGLDLRDPEAVLLTWLSLRALR